MSHESVEATPQKKTRKPHSQTLCERIDSALAFYYEACGRNDYYDEDGVGKFAVYCEEWGPLFEIFNDLKQAPDASVLVGFDDDFPFLQAYDDKEKAHERILEILNHCAKHGAPPALPSEYISDAQPMSECVCHHGLRVRMTRLLCAHDQRGCSFPTRRCLATTRTADALTTLTTTERANCSALSRKTSGTRPRSRRRSTTTTSLPRSTRTSQSTMTAQAHTTARAN